MFLSAGFLFKLYIKSVYTFSFKNPVLAVFAAKEQELKLIS